jgi:ABC-type uncharacterized transport system involved in gliding motility auxiliary subunit
MFTRIANILGWLGVALVLAGVATWLTRPALVPLRQGFAIAGLVCILIYAASQWREMAASLSKRQTRYGALSIASVLVVLALIVGVNYLAQKYSRRWDLSAAGEFTLSEQTRTFIRTLKEPLHIRVFGVPQEMQPFRDRLSEYALLSNKVKVEYLDIDKDRLLANQYEARANGTIVVEYQKRIERVTSGTAEQDITNAIIKAVQGRQRKVYFVTGHGEHDPASSDPIAGYSRANEALQRDNCLIAPLALAQQPDVPSDADVVVVAGPTRDYLPTEIESLRRYLNRGGKALMLLDPPDATTAPPLTNLVAFVGEWGMQVGSDIVVDVAGQARGRGPAFPVIANYPTHAITERFRFYTMFPLARTVTAVTGHARNAQPLLLSSDVSWAETDLKALSGGGSVSLDPTDKKGPVELGAAVALPAPDAPPATPPAAGQASSPPPRPETRLVVIGDSDFAANDAIGFQANRDFLGNAISWLAQQENLISIRPTPPNDRRVTVDANGFRVIALLLLVGVPGMVLAMGVHTWWRRRG